MLALVDCNNFYASCERIFRPDLFKKPVVVLSNNDGCVIARSNEAKSIGIEMGTPEFMLRDLVQKHDITIFSSNYSLYGDISERVMETLAAFTPKIEIYSIDEAFLSFEAHRYRDLATAGQEIRTAVYTNVGIPVSVGIAPSKTLAKMANRFAKKNNLGVLLINNDTIRIELLKKTPIGDIWGIGGQYQKLLARFGFKTAYDLSLAPDEFMRKQMKVGGQRILSELKGIPAIEWELETPSKKNICIARGFGKLLTAKNEIQEALASYTASCGEKLRKQGSAAGRIHVFIQTNAHRKNDKQYYRAITMQLPFATSYSGALIQHSMRALDLIYLDGYNYQKCGILMMDLVPDCAIQHNLFESTISPAQEKVMQTVDSLNKAMGKDLVRLARQGFARTFKLRQNHISKRFTTRINEILEIKI
jgi:DNA polymerase V